MVDALTVADQDAKEVGLDTHQLGIALNRLHGQSFLQGYLLDHALHQVEVKAELVSFGQQTSVVLEVLPNQVPYSDRLTLVEEGQEVDSVLCGH